MSKVVKINNPKDKAKRTKDKRLSWPTFPFPNGHIPAGWIFETWQWMPYRLEVAAWETVYEKQAEIERMDAELKDQAETLERLRRLLGGRLPTDGTYDVSFIAGGDLVQQINEGLQAIASDIHRRASIEEARKLAVSVKGEPSENSAAVKWSYEVKVSLAKAEGGGVAYIDKDGKLCPPESVTANQIMLPLDQTGKPAKAA
ncbi:MAG: hypothetical protein AB7D27_14840 [Desulfomicrobium sp.]